MEPETYEEWEEALETWLSSLPRDDPVHALHDADKCAAFDVWRERQPRELRSNPMNKATEIPMTDCGLSINVGEDGVWLHFKASDGKRGSILAGYLQEDNRGSIFGGALDSWCSDRQKQAEEIRASVKDAG